MCAHPNYKNITEQKQQQQQQSDKNKTKKKLRALECVWVKCGKISQQNEKKPVLA